MRGRGKRAIVERGSLKEPPFHNCTFGPIIVIILINLDVVSLRTPLMFVEKLLRLFYEEDYRNFTTTNRYPLITDCPR